ncbi:helix-turn-helix transcriptional regulator [Phocaeicola vulgatus]|uniref:helix-turn-helix transcriptional regulator n=1 Tax=Phocaeicola vulgatus TaxID=821 RepID=UPI0022E7155A|nr:LuxR family transcriptional regulator [Phocaeicola vulgatus]
MKKQSIYFLVIIILLVQTSCQQNNEEEDFFNNQITLLENNPRLYLSKIDSTQVTNLNNSKEATHFLLVSLANYYVNNYYPPKEVLQKSIHIFTKKKLIQQQLESLLFLAKTYKKEKNLKMEVQAIEKAIDIASQIEDKEWLCCLYGYLGDMYIRKYNMLKFIKYQTLANQCIEDIAFRDMDISTQVQTAKSFLYIGNHKKSYELLNLIESSIDKNNIYYNEIKCLQGITLFKTKQWALCIEKLQEAIILSQTDDFLFVCHSILTCLYKAIERYEILLRNLNGSSLDEAIQAYTHFCDKKNYEKKLSTYKYAALSSLFIASIGLLIYINKKRKQAYQIVALHQQIETLEGLNNIKDEAKMFILRDFEIAKQIAMLRYTQKEQSAKFIKELNRFNITQNNSLLTTQWDNFYKHIDLSFDNFYTLLKDNFSDLNEKELQLCCMMVAGFKTEEIAAIWMQSIFSVHKYKTNIRKKLKTPEGANIIAFLRSAPPFQ